MYVLVEFEPTRHQSHRDSAKAREGYDSDEVCCTNLDTIFVIPLATDFFAAVAGRRVDNLIARNVVKGAVFEMKAGI